MQALARLALLKELGSIRKELPNAVALARLKMVSRLRELVVALGGAVDLTTKEGFSAAIKAIAGKPSASKEDAWLSEKLLSNDFIVERFVHGSYKAWDGGSLISSYADQSILSGIETVKVRDALNATLGELNAQIYDLSAKIRAANDAVVGKKYDEQNEALSEELHALYRASPNESDFQDRDEWRRAEAKYATEVYAPKRDELWKKIDANREARAFEIGAIVGAGTKELQGKVNALMDSMKGDGKKIIDSIAVMSPVSDDAAKAFVKTNCAISKSVAARLKKTGYTTDIHQDIAEFYKITGGKLHQVSVQTDGDRRANATKIGTMAVQTINLGAGFSRGTLWHELGHHLEFDPICKKLANEFLEKRRESSNQYKLKDLVKGGGYRSDEIAYKDNFINPYVGKIYNDGCTEVFSMGLEHLSDPEKALEFAARDPEHFALIQNYITKRRCDVAELLAKAAGDTIKKNVEVKESALADAADIVIDTSGKWWAEAFIGYNGDQAVEVSQKYYLKYTSYKTRNLEFYGEYGEYKIFQGLVQKNGRGRFVKGFTIKYHSSDVPVIKYKEPIVDGFYRSGGWSMQTGGFGNEVAGGLPELRLYLKNMGSKT
jgi:hypothetical protein